MRSKKSLDHSDTGFFFWGGAIICVTFNSVHFSHSVVSVSLQPHGLHAASQASLPINSRNLLKLMSIESVIHPTISSSVVLFCYLQSFSVSGSFLVSQFFTSVSCYVPPIYSKFINSFTLKPTITLSITCLWQPIHFRLKALLHCIHSYDHNLDFVSWSSTTSESYTPVYHCCPGMADIQRGRGLFLCLHIRRQTDQINLLFFSWCFESWLPSCGWLLLILQFPSVALLLGCPEHILYVCHFASGNSIQPVWEMSPSSQMLLTSSVFSTSGFCPLLAVFSSSQVLKVPKGWIGGSVLLILWEVDRCCNCSEVSLPTRALMRVT